VAAAFGEGMWAGMTEFKWAMENDYFFDSEKILGALKRDISGLDLGPSKPFDAVAFAARLVPQGIGNLSPEDFGVTALTGDFDELHDATGLVLTDFAKFTQLQGSIDVPIVQPIIDAMNELKASIGDGALSAGLDSLTSTMAELGSMMAYMAEGSQNVEEMLLGQLSSLSSNMSSIFLAAAVKAFLDPLVPFWVGAALLAAAGASAFLGGTIGGVRSQSIASRQSSTPTPSNRSGTSYTGDTVTINYMGDVFTGDEREATTLATVRAGGGNR